ncbi:MAG: flagellar biosynthetic protein FliR [Treponema sp.]|nr:flagellar biosynthetic protein FliR [Treponema sp.]
MIDLILSKAPVYLLIFVRCFALIMTLPLFSTRAVSRIAKVALAGYMAFFIMGNTDLSAYNVFLGTDGAFSLYFIMLLTGEAFIGIIIGFYITIIFAAFSTAGQFTAFQMGFSAASTYDAMAQVENPLMGQFFNFIAMLVFMQNQWFQRLFLGGLTSSFKTLTALSVASCQESLVTFMLKGLTKLFADALIIALPIMGTLMLITICTGLLSKAAPQMNLLSEGFPIMILTAFLLIMLMLPSITDFFVRSFAGGFKTLEDLFLNMGGIIK